MATDLMNPVLCGECDNLAAKFHCNTCSVALCPSCKANHLKSGGITLHDVVPYAKKLNPKYLTGLFCHNHNTDDPEYWCDNCSAPICNSCITNRHKGHPVSKLTAVLSEKRDAMLREMKRLRDITVYQWGEVLKEAQEITADFLDSIDKTGNDLAGRGAEMHKHVDEILAQSQRALKTIEVSGLAKLKEQERYLTNRLQKLTDDVKRYEDILVDADTAALLRFKESSPQHKEKMKPPAIETAPLPIFIKGQNMNSLEAMFGQLTNQALKRTSTGTVLNKSSTSQQSSQPTEGDKTSIPPALSSSTNINTHKSLVSKVSVQSQFNVDAPYPQIVCVDQGLAWVKNWSKLELVNREGAVKNTIRTDLFISDLGLTSDGSIILADYNNKCIKSVSEQQTIGTLFMTSGQPDGLCCLQNDDIVVAFSKNRKVEIYNRNGKVIQKLDYKFRYPYKVAVNKVNQDVCICDLDSAISDTGKFIAVRHDGQLRYEYSGQGNEQFYPRKVCTDQMGYVLITDFCNHRVHILDLEGRFIQYLLTSKQGLQRPSAIDVDKEGYLWVGEYVNYNKGTVKVAKYVH